MVIAAQSMHCDVFKIYCAPANLGISRTSICRLNFAQRPIFSGLRFFNEPEISVIMVIYCEIIRDSYLVNQAGPCSEECSSG